MRGIILESCKIVFLIIILVSSIIVDLKTDRISNRIIISGLAVALADLFIHFSLSKFIYVGFGLCIPVICLLPLFYFHMLGAWRY